MNEYMLPYRVENFLYVKEKYYFICLAINAELDGLLVWRTG